jgi:hypothetical protein
LRIVDTFEGTGGQGTNGQGSIACVADLHSTPGLEIIGGGTVYQLPPPPNGVSERSECSGRETDPSEVAFCDGELLTVWDARAINGNAPRQGFCAVADVLGVDQVASPGPENPLDGRPELVLIEGGVLHVFDGETGIRYRRVSVRDAVRGGAPNVDDFDGDGFPEVGMAFGNNYTMVDFQEPTQNCPAWREVLVDGEEPPRDNPARSPGGPDCESDTDCADGAVCNMRVGACTCLHNGWARDTEDNSSQVTGSTLFDFNGDGAAEVIYNDECWFRIYSGLDGEVLFKEPSESRTRIEYPIVADADNDGNAEIIFAVSNESGFCSEGGLPWGPDNEPVRNYYNNGLEVWGDPTDSWVSARRIWNQHTYHVTNVLEDGRIPRAEPPGWRDLNGRTYNSYRSQPRSFGIAPDLVPITLQVVSPGEGCDALTNFLEISVRIQNRGDLRVGPGVVVAFFGIWDGDEPTPLRGPDNTPITRTLANSLEPTFVTRLSVIYDTENNGDNPNRRPAEVQVVVDAEGLPGVGAERECREDNNSLNRDVTPGAALADLALSNVSAEDAECGEVPLRATVTNVGSRPATDVVVRFYAGDPDLGGAVVGETTIPGTLAPGESQVAEAIGVSIRYGSPVVVHAYADPDNAIEECNDANNAGQADAEVECYVQ